MSFRERYEAEAPPSERFGPHVLVFAVTIAKFRRPANPMRCNVHHFHVFRWHGSRVAPAHLTCQCGAIPYD